MRIALFTDTYLPQINGVVSVLESVIPQLAKNNDVILFAPGSRKKMYSEKKGRLKIYWIPASPFPFYEGYRMSKVALKDIDRILEKEKIEIVHAHAPILLALQGVLIAKKKGIPSVATYHTHFPDYLPYLLDGKFPQLLNKISLKTTKKLIKFVYTLVDVPTAPTKELVRELRKYGVMNAIRLVNGVDLDKMDCKDEIICEFREKYSIPKNKKIVLYLGRVGFEKKIGVLLEALKKLKSKDWHMLVVGSGPQLDNYKQQANNLGIENITFTGFIDKKYVPAAYIASDIFVCASDSETFGLTFVEAMACKKPVIGVNKLGPKEIIDNEINGYLVRPGNSSQLAKRIDQLLKSESLRHRLGLAAAEKAKEFSLEKNVSQTLEIYEKLLENKDKSQNNS
jgi:1,2-diacylglycerol 3-alpha-glucosyltransferase